MDGTGWISGGQRVVYYVTAPDELLLRMPPHKRHNHPRARVAGNSLSDIKLERGSGDFALVPAQNIVDVFLVLLLFVVGVGNEHHGLGGNRNAIYKYASGLHDNVLG